MGQDIEVERVSSYRETEAVGGPPGQGRFLNAAAKLHTELEPHDLLRVLLEIETALQRERPFIFCKPRELLHAPFGINVS